MLDKKSLGAVAACLCVAGLTACGGSDSGGDAPAKASAAPAADGGISNEVKGALIQVINPLPNVFVDSNNDGAERAAKRLGLTNLQITQSQGDPAKEVANITNAITKGAKAIIINPVSSEGITPAIQAANAKGVCTIIAYNNIGKDPSDEVPAGSKAFIGWNEYQGGQAVAEALAKKMGGKGGVAIVQGIEAGLGAQQREKGARDLWKSKYPNIKVLGVQPADFDPAKARTVTENFVQRFGDQMQGLLAIGDQMGAASADVIAESKLKGKVAIGGFGAQKEFVDRIRAGKATATIPFAPTDDYDRAVELAADCISGDKEPVRVNTPDLPSVAKLADAKFVVTEDNVDGWDPQW
jgi:ribose transport system substrate-binding protein